MKIKGLVDEDFHNYHKPSMFIIFPFCSFKCDKECGKPVCQNGTLASEPTIEIEMEKIIERYLHNPISKAIVCGGLEPFDSYDSLLNLVAGLRSKTNDPIIIYTGYYPKEISEQIDAITSFHNIIIKYGRFVPDQLHTFDAVLGIELASSNQFAVFYN